MNIYLFKVNKKNTKKRGELWSTLTIMTPEWSQWFHSTVFIVNFEHVSLLLLMFLLVTLSRQMILGAGFCNEISRKCYLNINMIISLIAIIIVFAVTSFMNSVVNYRCSFETALTSVNIPVFFLISFCNQLSQSRKN